MRRLFGNTLVLLVAGLGLLFITGCFYEGESSDQPTADEAQETGQQVNDSAEGTQDDSNTTKEEDEGKVKEEASSND